MGYRMKSFARFSRHLYLVCGKVDKGYNIGKYSAGIMGISDK